MKYDLLETFFKEKWIIKVRKRTKGRMCLHKLNLEKWS